MDWPVGVMALLRCAGLNAKVAKESAKDAEENGVAIGWLEYSALGFIRRVRCVQVGWLWLYVE